MIFLTMAGISKNKSYATGYHMYNLFNISCELLGREQQAVYILLLSEPSQNLLTLPNYIGIFLYKIESKSPYSKIPFVKL